MAFRGALLMVCELARKVDHETRAAVEHRISNGGPSAHQNKMRNWMRHKTTLGTGSAQVVLLRSKGRCKPA
jgi:hypothetical protein